MTCHVRLAIAALVWFSCSFNQPASTVPAAPAPPDETCEILEAILTTPAACNAEGCFPPLADIDCIDVLRNKEGVGIPVSVTFVDSATGLRQPALREGQRCGTWCTGHRSVQDGLEKFVAIELKRVGPAKVEFDARLTIVGKTKGKEVGYGGTACAGVRLGEVRKEGSRWVMTSW